METFAEGLATRVAFELPQRIMWEQLDDFILVSDDEIRAAIVSMIETTRNLVEAAGAAPLAGALQPARAARGQAGRAHLQRRQHQSRRSSPTCSPPAERGRLRRCSVRPCRRDAAADRLPSSVASSGASTSCSASLEVATHLDEPASLVFWISSLWGGGALVLYGIFGRPEVATRLVVAGSLLGFLATLWTLIIPVLATALVFVTIRNSRPRRRRRREDHRRPHVRRRQPDSGLRRPLLHLPQARDRRRPRGPRRGLRRDRLAARSSRA